MLRKLIALSGLILVLLTVTSTAQAKHNKYGGYISKHRTTVHEYRYAINWHIHKTWYWQDKAQIARTHTEHSERHTKSILYLKWDNKKWKHRQYVARKHYMKLLRYVGYIDRGLLCIHSYEGSWTDPNAPYWGGLQMDQSFQNTYGHEFVKKWGTADHWPIWAQMEAGRRGYYARGWRPWPNTAHVCGLI